MSKNNIRTVCVFCGASNNVPKDFIEEGVKLGKKIADESLHLIFGAGDCGLMGAVASGVLDNGGTVTGVFPRILEGIEQEHKSLTETIIVDDMHTRKMHMFKRADAFIIMPGGFGTMDETFEVITWKQLNTHKKPIVFYNYKNYWDYFNNMVENFISLGFASEKTRSLYSMASDFDVVFNKLYDDQNALV